jgi:hypothetical protein
MNIGLKFYKPFYQAQVTSMPRSDRQITDAEKVTMTRVCAAIQ